MVGASFQPTSLETLAALKRTVTVHEPGRALEAAPIILPQLQYQGNK